MKMKKILSVAIALCLSLTMSITAFATGIDLPNADAPSDATVGDPILDKDGNPTGDHVERPSTGEATITNDGDMDNGGNLVVTGDDSAHNDTTGRTLGQDEGAEINVWAKVIETGAQFKIYNVDIEWGYMKFVYSNNGQEWDPVTHTYIGTGGDPSWWIDNSLEAGSPPLEGYLDGVNNIIKITNHSNGAIDAQFAYTMLTDAQHDQSGQGNVDASWFNDDSTKEDAVVGGFYEENAKALDGATVLSDPDSDGKFNTLSVMGSEITLKTADGRMTTAAIIGALQGGLLEAATYSDDFANYGEVFFAFSGTPDDGRGTVLPQFTKVGVITVTIVPNTDTADGINDTGSWSVVAP